MWWLETHQTLPNLAPSYLFTGCRNGVLQATAVSALSLEQIVRALWELVDYARGPWIPSSDWTEQLEQRDRNERRKQMLIRLGVVAGVTLLATLVRRSPTTV